MRLHLGWSTDRSKQVAEALKWWLPLLSPAFQPRLSEAASGHASLETLVSQVDEAGFAILCVTADDLENPWLAFEAGMLASSGKRDRATAYRLDVDPSDLAASPLALLPNLPADEDGTLALVRALNEAFPESSRQSADRLGDRFRRLWPDLAERLPAAEDTTETAPRPAIRTPAAPAPDDHRASYRLPRPSSPPADDRATAEAPPPPLSSTPPPRRSSLPPSVTGEYRPLSAPTEWYVASPSGDVPTSLDELRGQVTDGLVVASTLVRKEGMSGFLEAQAFPELRELF